MKTISDSQCKAANARHPAIKRVNNYWIQEKIHNEMLSKRNIDNGKCLSIFQTEKITDRTTSGIKFPWSY